MVDVTTPVLGLVKQTIGGNRNTWGAILNGCMDLLEGAIYGQTALTVDGTSDVTLTSDQRRKRVLNFDGTLGDDQIIIIPNLVGRWTVANGTTGSFDVSFKTSGGAAVVVPQGCTCTVWCDGNNGVYLSPAMSLGSSQIILPPGLVSAPGLAFDPGSGFFRTALNAFAATLGNSKVVDFKSTGIEVTGNISATGQITGGGIWRTGDAKLSMQPTAETGWIVANDGTIGNTSSGASFVGAAYHDIYVLAYNNINNTYAPVSGGRSGDAEADWLAQKSLGLTQMLGRAIAIAGAGGGLTSRALGEILGVEDVTLTANQIAQHEHTALIYDPTHLHNYTGDPSGTNGPTGGGGVPGPQSTQNTSAAATGVRVWNGSSLDRTGAMLTATGGAAHTNMPPTAFAWRAHIKL